jgi:toxin-antitoxin system PIN domain toxin
VSLTLDANILLYASDRDSPYRERANEELERWAGGPEPLYLFWPVLMAYLRISTHPGVFSRPLAFSDAAANIERLLGRRHIRTPGEDDGFWRTFSEAASESSIRGDLVPDTHVVALMRQHGVRTIVTRDRDFRRFDGVKVRDPFR